MEIGKHTYSESILTLGVQGALRQIDWDSTKFLKRKGLYEW